jgi:hypothetical protein
VKCYCCGEERDVAMLAPLLCHDEIKICRVCVGWLMRRTGGVDVTPTLPVREMNEATRFCETAGFDVEPDDDGFAFVHLNDQSVFDLDHIEDSILRRITPAATSSPTTWTTGTSGSPPPSCRSAPSRTCRGGMHEFTLTDPSGNNIRIGRSTSEVLS